jgi:sulfate adenylyltransferase
MLDGIERERAVNRASRCRSIQLSERSTCDVELLATGAFSPLTSFMDSATYASVVRESRLPDGKVFPIPITLPVADSDRLKVGEEVALRSEQNDLVALMVIEEIYPRDPEVEAAGVYGTSDVMHPMIAEMSAWSRHYASGPLRVVALPKRHGFAELRQTPREVRRILETFGTPRVVAFQTRNPIHRAHEEVTKRAIARVGGALLIHPVVGMGIPGDVDRYTRMRCYKAVEKYYDPARTLLSVLPLAMRMAGPREAVWHAIVRRNYGASHFIVGRDHAGPGRNSVGQPFYGPHDAQTLALSLQTEIGVEIIPCDELYYVPDEDRYEEEAKLRADVRRMTLSGTQVREEYLRRGRPLPEWFARPEVSAVLRSAFPPAGRSGCCVWFTGLSGAGKSAIAQVLAARLMELGRQVTFLDGDAVRTHLSKGLGFGKEDRDTNVRRIGFVASEIVRHHGIAVCAAVSPYATVRSDVRRMVGTDAFVEIFVNTPLEVCERRDTKGIYAKARRGEVKGMTGIDDPYEPPARPELVLTTTDCSPEENAARVVRYLDARNIIVML